MKKYTLFSFVFVLSLILIGSFGLKSANAYDSGCNGAGPYSTTTGQLCSTTPNTPSDCAPGDNFSYLTGQPCSTTTTTTPKITVIYPNGGEFVNITKNFKIKWTSSNLSGDYATAYFWFPNGMDCQIGTVPISQGFINATVKNGSYQCPGSFGTYITNGQYKIDLTVGDGSTSENSFITSDYSDNFFTVTGAKPAQYVNITSPQSGNSWMKGQNNTILWNASSYPTSGYVALSLVNVDGSSVGTINNIFFTSTNPISSQSFVWDTKTLSSFSSDSNGNAIPPGNIQNGVYKIGVSVIDTSIPVATIVSTSDSPTFNIVSATTTTTNSSLSIAKNTAFGDQTYSVGTANVKVGSFILTVGNAQGVTVKNIDLGLNNNNLIQNLHLVIETTGQTFGYTETTPITGDNPFNGSYLIAPGSSIVVDAYADILSSATNTPSLSPAVGIIGCFGTGATSNSGVSCSGVPLLGQNISVSGTTTTPTTATIPQVQNLKATAMKGDPATIILTWSPVVISYNQGIATEYAIYRSMTSGFVPSTSNLIGWNSSITYNDQSMVSSTLGGANVVTGTYYYVVAAGDWKNNLGPVSTQVSATVGSTTILPPGCTSNTGWSNTTGMPCDGIAQAPTVTISANPTSVSSGGSSTITWSSTNATSCIASGGTSLNNTYGWQGYLPTSGTFNTSPSSTATYQINCSNSYSGASASATVYVSGMTTTTTTNATPVISSITGSPWTSSTVVNISGSNFNSSSQIEIYNYGMTTPIVVFNPLNLTSDGTNLQFSLPSSFTSVANSNSTYQIDILNNSQYKSNAITFTIVSGTTPIVCPVWGCNGPTIISNPKILGSGSNTTF